jgi:hypothetical protein
VAAGSSITQPRSRAATPDFDAAKALYDVEALVHANSEGVTGGGPLDKSFYGETFIPECFARESLGKIPPLFEYYSGDSHPILFFEKPIDQ